MTYPEKVNQFLEEIKEYIDTPEQRNGLLIIPVKEDVVQDADKFIPFYKEKAVPLQQKLGLEKYCSLSLRNPINRIGFSINLAGLHADRLAIVFNKVTPQEVTESIKFLSDCGWNDLEFAKQYHVSPITLWRYKSGKFQGKRKGKEAEAT